MITVNQNFQQIHQPYKAFLVFKSLMEQDITYIESYDIGPSGRPINAHPLTTAESISLARSLAESSELNSNFLQTKGFIPENLLYCSIALDGYAIWYTRPQKVALCFSQSLGIPNGLAAIPALIWKADKHKLEVFAIKARGNAKPDLHTVLFHAPFFNIYDSGKVCMGTVKINISEGLFLEGFINAWEHYFFNSNFSHAMPGHAPVKSNIVQLWRKLVIPTKEEHVRTGNNPPPDAMHAFPEHQMKPTGRLLKDLMI